MVCVGLVGKGGREGVGGRGHRDDLCSSVSSAPYPRKAAATSAPFSTSSGIFTRDMKG
jgi:hypothetical protein